MRFSGWRATAPFKDSVSPKVQAVVESALVTMGAEADPECWVAWGDDPTARYALFAPTPSGLVHLNVRVSVGVEGPRAGGKVIRWNRVQLGELAVEIQAGHRLVTFQVEAQPLNGADAAADAIASFAQALFAAADGRPAPASAGRAAGARAGSAGSAAKYGSAAKSGSTAKAGSTARSGQAATTRPRASR